MPGEFDQDSPSSGGGDVELDLDATLRGIVEARGEALGDGAPPPVEETEPTPTGDGDVGTSDDPPAAEPKPAEAPAPAPAEPPGRRPPDLNAAPTSWRPERAALWANLPVEVREEIHRREEDSAKGVAEIKPFADEGRRFKQMVAPFEQELRQYNIDPHAEIQGLLQVRRTLALGSPEMKAQIWREIGRQFGVPMGAPGQTEGAQEEPGWVDPQVKALQEEVKQIKSQNDEAKRQAALQRQASAAAEITRFSQDPAHPYFDEVADEITQLIQGSGGKMPLKEAYEKAVWMNAGVRDRLISERQDAAKKEAEASERKRAEEAAKARGLNVKSKQKPASDTSKPGTIDDTLKETYARLTAKEQ